MNTHHGDLIATKGVVYQFEEITGGLDARGADTKTTASLQEMIVAYRVITGACQQGVSHYLTGKAYKGKLSVQFVIDETQGRYGHDTFKTFFANNRKK